MITPGHGLEAPLAAAWLMMTGNFQGKEKGYSRLLPRGSRLSEKLSRWQRNSTNAEGSRESYTREAAADILKDCESALLALLQPQELQPLLHMHHCSSAACACDCAKQRGARTGHNSMLGIEKPQVGEIHIAEM